MNRFAALCFIAASLIPVASHAKPSLSSCAEFDSLGEDDGSLSARARANVYLNGALDQLEATVEGPLKPAQILKRQTCVSLALQSGADANNKGTWSPPLLMAVSDKDETAVKLLLAHGANPNTKDHNEFANSHVGALQQACSDGNEAIALDLLNAGADPVADGTLWTAATQAESQVVAAMLKTGKIPKNQLLKFSNIGDDQQTALDASEVRVAVLKQYQDKFSASSKQDKIDFVNGTLIYAYYIGLPSLDAKGDPDAFVNGLSQRQNQVSLLLRSAGWQCHQPNCGVSQ